MKARLQSLRKAFDKATLSLQGNSKSEASHRWRDESPACYHAPIAYKQQVRLELAHELLSSGLSWYWVSARSRESNSYENPNLPPKRPLTQLTQDTAADLLNDLGDRTRDDFGRQLVLCGVDPEMEESFLEAANLPVAQEEFVSGKGPIRILVFVQDDMPYQYIFVPHEPI